MTKITARATCDKCSYFFEVSFYPQVDSIQDAIDKHLVTQGWLLYQDKNHMHPQLYCPSCKKDKEKADEALLKDAMTSTARVTLSGKAPCEDYDGPAPCPIDPKTGMHEDYWVLPKEELAKGFVRPVRTSYIHEKCGQTTRMNATIAETYARNPNYYSATFCCECGGHFPVGKDGEFKWTDGTKVGT